MKFLFFERSLRLLRERGEVIAGRFYLKKQVQSSSSSGSSCPNNETVCSNLNGLQYLRENRQKRRLKQLEKENKELEQTHRKHLLNQYCYNSLKSQQRLSKVIWDEKDEELVKKLLERNSLSLLLENDCHLNFAEDGSFIGLYAG